jgi:predicted nucleotidyltransferase
MSRTSSTPDLTASDRKTVDELAALLPSRWPVDSLVLYGSKARGDDTPESDIDLLVLTGRPLAPEERPWRP